MSDIVKEADIVEVSQLRPMLQKFNESLGIYINDDQRFRLGKVLTLIDASIGDPEQRKAVKDIVNDFWWNNNGSQPRTSDSPMSSPHTDIRGLTAALGFDLYPNYSGEGLSNIPAEKDWYETDATERYIRVARDVDSKEARTNNN